MSWAALPGSLLLAVGGVFGVAAQRSCDVAVSRRRGVWAASCAVVGLVEVGVILALA